MKKQLSAILLDFFDLLPEAERPQRAPAPEPSPAPGAPPPALEPALPDAWAAAARNEAQVLALLRRAGAEYRRVVFTRNRRIMVSVGRDRSVIRMNAAFAAAPEHVLAAVAVLFSRTRGARKTRARETVRAFIDVLPPPPPPPGAARPARRRGANPLDRPLVERLQAEFDRVNAERFGGRLPRVPLHLSRQMRRRNGHFTSSPLEIVISHRLCVRGAAGEAEHTLRHEMIHLWQFVEGLPVDHGAAFRRMAKKLDVHPRATRQVRWEE